MKQIFIPLQGPTGERPKAPAVGGWQSPGYAGVQYPLNIDWGEKYDDYPGGPWFGLRCDGLVVIDCDTREAASQWILRTHSLDTWTRKTPRGFHFIYTHTEGSPTTNIASGLEKTDIRAGLGGQIVFWAPGYRDLHAVEPAPFNPQWLPRAQRELLTAIEEWDEMPDGIGNNTMTAIAGALRRQGMSFELIFKCLVAIDRLCMTREPMPREDIASIARSVSRYAPQPDVTLDITE